MYDYRADIAARASRILRQMAGVENAQAELAQEIGAGGAGAFEKESARLWLALANVIDEGFDAVKAAAVSSGRDLWVEKPSALTFWGNLSPAQEGGTACLICGGDINLTYPGQFSAVINSKQMSIHINPDWCTRELKKKIDKEIPF